MKTATIAAMLSGSLVLSGCMTTEPATGPQLSQALLDVTVARSCVEAGRVTELSSMAAYIAKRERFISTASPNEVASTRRQLQQEFPSVPNSTCNTYQLAAVREAQIAAQQQQDSQRLSNTVQEINQSFDAPPTYANCVTTAGITRCYTY